MGSLKSDVQIPGLQCQLSLSSLQWVDKCVPSLLANLTLEVLPHTDPRGLASQYAEVHEQMSQSGCQSERKSPVFSFQASLVLIYRSTEGRDAKYCSDLVLLSLTQAWFPRERWMGAECEVAGRYDRHNGSNSLLNVFLDSGGKKMSSNIFWIPEEDEILIDFVRNHNILYNIRHPDYRKAQTKQHLLESIGTTLEKSGIAAKKRSELLSFLDSFAVSQRTTTTNVGSSQGLSDVTQLSSTGPDFDSGPEILAPDSNDYFGKMEEEKFQGTPPPKKKKLTHSEERFKLLKQIAERKVAPQNEPDEADLFFGSMAKIYRRFPRKEQAELRTQITNLISNAELRMIQSDASPACSTPRKEGCFQAKPILLTGHDCLCAHLFRFNLVTSPICVLCDTGQDMTAAHLDECSALNDLNSIVKRYWKACCLMT
ncbi:uncharacterized protein TNCV_3942631 [Trichonephila clavipes]|nr:uncharacterized protein TNCV_3942631 [Trichonephila clavipes]